MKKILSLALALMLMLSCVSLFSVSAEETTVLSYHPNGDDKLDYLRIAADPVTIGEGYALEYDVYLEDDIPGLGAINIDCLGQSPMRDLPDGGTGVGFLDQDLIGTHPQVDISDYAFEKWYHRSIGLSLYAGATLEAFVIGSEVGAGISGTALFQNIQIVDADGMVVAFLDTTKVPEFTRQHGSGTSELKTATAEKIEAEAKLMYAVKSPVFESEGVWSCTVNLGGDMSALTKDAWIGIYETGLETITAEDSLGIWVPVLADKTADMPEKLTVTIGSANVDPNATTDKRPVLTEAKYYDIVLFADSDFTVVARTQVMLDDPNVFDTEYVPDFGDDEPEETEAKDEETKATETGAKETTPTTTEKGGCGSAIGAAALVLAAALVAPVAIIRKKD